MKLTKKQAIDLSIELWEYLAKTGAEHKLEWPEWDKYGTVDNDCFLCEYSGSDCDKCPYYNKFSGCYEDITMYTKWDDGQTSRTRKKYATLFLKQLRELKK